MEDLSYILSRVILYINHLYIISSLFMRIHVRFFASHKERIGCSNLLLELNEGSKIINLIDKINQANPGFSKKPESLVAAVNQEYQDLNFVLRDNDEVAFIPPVSGGMINDQNFKYSCRNHV